MTADKRYRPHTLRDYLRIAFRRRWVIVLPLLLVGLASVPICMLTPPRYVAVAIVSRKELAIASRATAGVAVGGEANASLKTLREEILAWPRVDKVLRLLKLDVDLKTQGDRQRRIRDLQQRIRIAARAHSRGVDIVSVSVRGSDPVKVTDIANAISDVYIERTMSAGEEEIKKSIVFLKKQVATYRSKLHEAEDELDAFQREHRTDIPSIKQKFLDRILDAETRKISSEFSLRSAEVRLLKIKEQLKETPVMIQGEGVMQRNPEFERLKNEIADLEGRQRAMERVMTKKHPDLVRVRTRLAEAKKELEKTQPLTKGDQKEIINPLYIQLLKDRMRSEQEISAHKASIKGAIEAVRANEFQLKSLASAEKRYTDLVRARNEADKIYSRYHQNLIGAQERLTHEREQLRTVVEVIAKAQVPFDPVGPDKLKIVLACLATGVAAATGLAFSVEFFDYSLRSSEDAVNALGIPVLGTITLIRTQSERKAKRRRRIAAGIALLAFITAGVVAALIIERFHPGSLNAAWAKIRVLLRWAAKNLGDMF